MIHRKNKSVHPPPVEPRGLVMVFLGGGLLSCCAYAIFQAPSILRWDLVGWIDRERTCDLFGWGAFVLTITAMASFLSMPWGRRILRTYSELSSVMLHCQFFLFVTFGVLMPYFLTFVGSAWIFGAERDAYVLRQTCLGVTKVFLNLSITFCVFGVTQMVCSDKRTDQFRLGMFLLTTIDAILLIGVTYVIDTIGPDVANALLRWP